MSLETEDRNPVELLADEFAARLRRGERPSVAEYVEKYPELAVEIRDVLPTVAAIEQLRASESAERQSAQAVVSPPVKVPEFIGDYRIVREVGRGGMGVVYEAEQQSLSRRVALKVLSSNAADSPHRIERFQREAKAAARLHHTNIVPVFGVGEQEGLHYYVMQFIDGVPLDEVLVALQHPAAGSDVAATTTVPGGVQSETPQTSAASAAAGSLTNSRIERRKRHGSSVDGSHATVRLSEASHVSDVPDTDAVIDPPAMGRQGENGAGTASQACLPSSMGPAYWKNVAHIGAELGEALHYAHAQGILHRDVKPSNVLLDNHGIVWITDFGLAKHEGHAGVTKTGDTVGTLRYMAPEQFNAETDARSDVYSLGLTLYEMLTLRPAFDDGNHGALIKRKMEAAPAAPRLLNLGIPRDLETITLKACSIDASDRYQSAQELAADLERFLEDLPILAQPITSLERLWRFSRRNPTIAALSSLAVALLIMVAAVSAVGHYRTNRALARVSSERQKVEEERNRATAEYDRAEANLALALQALDGMINNISARGVPQSLEMELDELDEDASVVAQQHTPLTAADAELLQGLLKFFDEFARQNGSDLRVETAKAYRSAGEIQQRLGRTAEAISAFHEALRIYEELAEKETRIEDVVARAQILSGLGVAQRNAGQIRESMSFHRAAIELLDNQPPAIAATRECRFQLAQSYLALLSMTMPSGALVAVEDLRDLGRQRSRQRATRQRPDVPTRKRELPGSGARRPEAQRPSPFDTIRQRGIEILEELIAEDPQNPDYRLAMALCHKASFRSPFLRRGGPARDSESLDRAIELLEQLSADHPQQPRYRYELADMLLISTGRPSTKGDRLNRSRVDRAAGIAEELVTQFPHVHEYSAVWAGSQIRLAALWHSSGKRDEAEACYGKAIDELEQLAERFPAMSVYQMALAGSRLGLGELKREQRNLDASREVLQQAIADLDSHGEGESQNPYTRQMAGKICGSLARTLAMQGQHELAAGYLRRAEEARRSTRHPGGRRGSRGAGSN